MQPMRLIIADDHPLFRMGLRAALEREGFAVLAEANNGEEAVTLGLQHLPEAIVLDVRMPKRDGIESARLLRQQGYKGILAMLTTFSEPALVRQAAQAGADAYWSKELAPEVIATRLLRLARGDEPKLVPPEMPTLTAREAEVLSHLVKGLSVKEIAREIGLSPETVKDYLDRLYGKLEARNRVEAVEQARRWGFL